MEILVRFLMLFLKYHGNNTKFRSFIVLRILIRIRGYCVSVFIQIQSLPKVGDRAIFAQTCACTLVREEYSKSSYCSTVLEYSVLKFLIIEFFRLYENPIQKPAPRVRTHLRALCASIASLDFK